MFTEGLDTNAVKWVKQGSGNEATHSMTNQRARIDPVSSRNGSRGVGLPPPSKFKSGVVPLSQVLPRDDTNSTSEDMSTDSDTEVYGGRYSLDSSSPQDDRVPSVSNNRYHDPVQRRPQYHVYSSDVSSSVEMTRNRNVGDRLRGANRYDVRSSVYTEDESDDSVESSEYSTTQVGASIENLPRKDAYTSKEDFPSAPPISGSFGEIKQEEDSPCSKTNITTSRVDSHDLEANSSVQKKTPFVAVKEDHKQETLNTSRSIGAKTGSDTIPTRLPTFHASSLGPWHGMIAYDACVRLCLHAWAKGCMEAPVFLENECALLRRAFSLQQVLLQPEEELLVTRASEVGSEGNTQKPKKMVGKMKVEVRKVKMAVDPPTGCSCASIKPPKVKTETVKRQLANLQSKVSSGWRAVRNIHFSPRVPANGSFSRHSMAYMQASSQYIKQVSGLLKVGVSTLRSSSSGYEVQESYLCLLRLKSSAEGDTVRMQPGSRETHTFLPDSLGDDLIVEVQDSKGNHFGRVLAQVATISEDQNDKLRWWSIYREPEHELVGKIQLHINYTTRLDENSLKCGSIAETMAYDFALEVAMKEQNFRQRNLLLHDPWKWLLAEFATYYGVSDAYTKLRYLSYIMDVATPTNDCLSLVYDLLLPVIMKGHTKGTLSHQENRILGEIEEQIEQIFSVVFENYKSLDELSPSGVIDVFRPATGDAAPVLEPAVKLYNLLYDILSPEAQNKLYSYFQAAAKKRSRRHLTETDEYLSGTGEGNVMDPVTVSTAYQKMKSLCLNIRNEIYTDIQIHNCNILPSFIDLPNLSSAIYSAELCNRLRSFLVTCPPSGPSRPVTELVIATADFQKDLATWNINPVKGGVDAKELFHLYIIIWIQDKRLSLLETCKLDKVKWSGVRTQHSTTPFVDEMYGRLKETLNDYDVIICRWPEYTFALENAIVDIEKAIIEALDKQFADVVAPLKENMTPKKFGFKYVQKLAKRTTNPYVVPPELGILLNSMKRMLDVLRPKIEVQLKSWGSCCIPEEGNTAAGERLSEVTVILRSKFRNYLQAVVEKLVENTRLQNGTKLKKILQDSKDSVTESEIRNRMQPLTEQLMNTVNHLHTIFETHVFIAVCRGYWDWMGQDVLSFLENRKENKSVYKGSRVAVSILDDTFASQMQKLLGNALQEKDLEPPRSIVEVRSMLCKDTGSSSHKKNSYFY
ncbi:hypothetical protein HanRHA438_Chr15g0718351 [Helianthus annuus]|uniref:Pesticidal crystal cry8Ba protein n=1 Tax=Helianthus annuus TaxID=4232 RepID=A0A251SAL5_HELAN|nr:uncharacterized protein LOC110912043 [Helianthus annuus]KAF5765638.1 hypothetical protein HanXRQr2_Chr15g0706121 [Helianthus annuus]KAJ0452134.1 hypothetical protein HanHA300_Chr15g0575511 [Helianthus annuus]KAJ0456928.1 hypothetical protein HanIR_Chr15g0768051 [Helianthus annuus]KAJ0474040.1 hypothetical protein HanHA89_Chr15g0625231 [Helianthus annuus]KAJ0649603.1 hypothetical protein HanLR1_Chr15g0586211 [Helianthus annuus]